VGTKVSPWWDDWDFSYLKGKPLKVKQTAMVYEYSRQSEAVRNLVDKMAAGNGDYVPDDTERGEFPEKGLFALLNCIYFPKWSFEKLLKRGLHGPLSKADFGVASVRTLSFVKLEKMRENPEMFPQYPKQIAMFELPWGQYSDDELIKMIALEIPRMRPHEFSPSMKRPGRKGRGVTRRVDDLLNQLAALRMKHLGMARIQLRHEVPVTKGSEKKVWEPVYRSDTAWNSAAKDALNLIADLLNRPLLS
jgi:hypothetical protein